MEPAQSKSGQDNQNSQKPFCRQPITCPWDTNQPYPSTLNKNRACDPTGAKTMLNIPFTVEPRSINEKTCPSLQHSSSQFFYFLRLMQLFPETHPATLHTVLSLCKNDFFCAVDKLLYAKRCKALYSRSQGVFKRCAMNRTHPYCSYGRIGNQQDKARGNETVVNFDVKEVGDGQRTPREKATQETSDVQPPTVTKNEETFSHLPLIAQSASVGNNDSGAQKTPDEVTSLKLKPPNLSLPDTGEVQQEQIKCDEALEGKAYQ